MKNRMEEAPKELWQRYEVIGEIQENARESTLKIRERSSGVIRALRTVHPGTTREADQRARFQENIRSTLKLRHEHIAKVYEVYFSPEGSAFLVSELFEGTTSSLEDFCDFSRLLPVSRILEIASQALEAINYLHQRGLIHRCFSPRSILLTQDSQKRTRIKIIDFSVTPVGQPISRQEDIGLEKAMYGSPEELVVGDEANTVTLQSILYSWAVVIYQLLTGTLPIEGKDLAGWMRAHALAKPKSFKETDPLSRASPKELRRLVLAPLAKSPEERPRTTGELIVGLRELRAPEHHREPTKIRRLVPVLLVLALVGIGIFLLWPYLRELGASSEPSARVEQGSKIAKAEAGYIKPPTEKGPDTLDGEGETGLGGSAEIEDDTAATSASEEPETDPYTDGWDIEGETGAPTFEDPEAVDTAEAETPETGTNGIDSTPLGTESETTPDPDRKDSRVENPSDTGVDSSSSSPASSSPASALTDDGAADDGTADGAMDDEADGRRVSEPRAPTETTSAGKTPNEEAESQVEIARAIDREPSRASDSADRNRQVPTLKTASGSSLLLKVVGMSDNIPIRATPGGSEIVRPMDPLKPYFVFDETQGHYQVSSNQAEDGILGFVAVDEVEEWNTREGLHFVAQTFRQDRRTAVAAWDEEKRIRKFAKTLDESYGPTYQEELQTRISSSTREIIPYPLLDIKDVPGKETVDGKKRKIHQVLIPAKLAAVVETDLSREQVQTVAGAVTFCVVFDATQSMGRYAKDFAGTIESMLESLDVDARLASAGFVLFRDLKNAKDQRFEIAHPMPLDDSTKWLRERVRTMVGGDDAAEPVLDAVVLAQKSFLWNGGTAIRGARRVIIVVANEDAKPETISLASSVPAGLDAEEVAGQLRSNPIPISVFALQAGNEDGGNLLNVMRILADSTGGELYQAAASSSEISSEFSKSLKGLLQKRLGEGQVSAAAIQASSEQRAGGGTVIALDVLDEDVKRRLEAQAADFHIADGGLVINKAWLFEDPNLYSEKILIEKNLLEWLVRFFNTMTDSTLDAVTLRQTSANLLEALIGERIDDEVEIQELLEKQLGIHFTTNLLSFEVERLASLGPDERLELQEQIQDATGALADFLDMNSRHFDRESRIWMPVSYLP